MSHMVASSAAVQLAPSQKLLTVRQVQELLHVDRSTIYRMASDGRLPCVRVGRQLRFSVEDIRALVAHSDRADGGAEPSAPGAEASNSRALDPIAATAAVEVAASLLNVMMVVTDMSGRPVTPVVNPCPSFTTADDAVVAECLAEWQELASDADLAPRFRASVFGFECARAFVRDGSELIGMVLIGGVAPVADSADSDRTDGLFCLTHDERLRALEALPLVARAISEAQTIDARVNHPLSFHLSPASVGA